MATLLRDPKIQEYDILALQEPWRNPIISTTHNLIAQSFHLCFPNDSREAPARDCFFVNKRIDPNARGTQGKKFIVHRDRPAGGRKLAESLAIREGAFTAKEKYDNELVEYKRTDAYREYSLYLAEFKARQANQQQATATEAAKRPKLEATTSVGSSGTGSTGTSKCGDTPNGRIRLNSTSSFPSPPVSTASVSSSTTNYPAPAKAQHSPPLPSPTVLPGYRDSIFAGTHQNLGWRDGHRSEDTNSLQQLPRVASDHQQVPCPQHTSHTSNTKGASYGSSLAPPDPLWEIRKHIREPASTAETTVIIATGFFSWYPEVSKWHQYPDELLQHHAANTAFI
ncbi:hypothetical protein BGZ57DRAFT_1010168 [Hyaloscypha finlandica]|nr:hypothetical protein BGZ57DRAFT_1010168 [Hyaloscypha finlandica]